VSSSLKHRDEQYIPLISDLDAVASQEPNLHGVLTLLHPFPAAPLTVI
jgi:hypothetical protein